MVNGGREHQKAARDGHVGRDPGSLGAQGFLDDLNQDLLAGLEKVSNLGLRLVGAGWALVRVTRFETVELLKGVDDIGDVQKCLARQPNVDESGLHAWKDLRHTSLVDIADDGALTLAFDGDLGHVVVLENGRHRLVAARGHDQLFVHSEQSPLDPSAGRDRDRAHPSTPRGHPPTRPADAVPSVDCVSISRHAPARSALPSRPHGGRIADPDH